MPVVESAIFTKTSAYSLGGVLAIGIVAYIGSKSLLPRNARWQDRYTFVWLVNFTCCSCSSILISLFVQAFDALIHFIFEGSFLWMSVFGRQVNTQTGPLAQMCMLEPPILRESFLTIVVVLGREYAASDFRWGVADPTVVSLEILTVLGAGPLCCYILKQLANDDPARHYWLIVLSTAELYGGFVPLECKMKTLFTYFIFNSWMTFCPEWLTGSPNLNTSNVLHLWVYLVVSFYYYFFSPSNI